MLANWIATSSFALLKIASEAVREPSVAQMSKVSNEIKRVNHTTQKG